MKVLLLFVGLLFGSNNFQKKLDINFIGTWKVTEVNIDKNTPAAKNPMFNSLVHTSMGRMVFVFKPDHHLSMNGNAGGGMFGKQAPDGEWNYDTITKTLSIKSGNIPDTHTVYIVVSKDDKGQVFFRMQNAPVTLKVNKQ